MRSILFVALAACIACAGEASAGSPRPKAAHSSPARSPELLHTGTLVVVIPTGDGAVVAADSRATLSNGQVIDTARKIARATSLPVAAFVTGLAGVSLSRPGDTRTRMEYDVAAVLRGELGRLDHIPEDQDFQEIVDTVADIIRHSRSARAGKANNNHTVIGLVTFRQAGALTTIYTGRLDIDLDGALTVNILPSQQIDGGHAVALSLYGESDYAVAHVLRGAGRARLSPGALHFLNVRATVDATDSQAAYAAARDIIQTVGRRMAEDQPGHVTVGGPTRGVLVGPSGTRALDGGASN